VLHLLFHPAHILKPGVEEALRTSVTKARERGMEWWTAAAINRWERDRRTASWRGYSGGDGRSGVTLDLPDVLEDATVLWLVPEGTGVYVDGAEHPMKRVTRWGFEFALCVLTGERAGEVGFEVKRS
jgi:hypothetical protein